MNGYKEFKHCKDITQALALINYLEGCISIPMLTAWHYGALLTATRYGIMATNAVTRSSFLSKSLVAPPLPSEL